MAEKMKLLEEVFHTDGFDADTELADIRNWDSLAALTFIIVVEEEFGKSVTGAQVREMETVRDMLDVMEE
ncbi:MAG: phosphopantetheine-binding protein [Oscillospiraceae bacterium]|nr:phosphopantetheine-binding protein [Oscillospiraceae bacterium]